MRSSCYRFVALLIFWGTGALCQTPPLLQITSPATGTIVSPGQTVPVVVTVDPSVLNVTVIASSPIGFASGPDSSGRFLLNIPANTPIGQYQVTAVGQSVSAHDLVESPRIMLAVENPLPIVKLEPLSNTLHFNQAGIFMPIQLKATFSDGSQGDVSRSVNTTYRSADTTIATVDTYGTVTAVSAGSTTILITASGLQATVGVTVDQPVIPTGADLLPPHTTASTSTEPNSAGWFNSNVTITLNAVDEPGGTGVQSVHVNLNGAQSAANVFPGSTTALTISQEGITTLTYFAVDGAGNKEKRKGMFVRLDKTPPVIIATRSPLPNANNWNNTNVTVSFTCTDNLSGVAPNGLTGPIVLSSDGANQQVTGSCQDIAGNVASTTVTGINIDTTPPQITGLPSACALWPPNHKLVQVATVNAADNLSGLASFSVNVSSNETDGTPPEFVISGAPLQPQKVELRAERSGNGNGRVYTITSQATDLAGNVALSSSACTVPHDQSGK